MRPNALRALLAQLLIASTVAFGQALPSDPAIVAGELPNGLRYMVRQHAHPPGRATVWVHMHTGSLNETDAQRGLAHYLEHMAFNGSENFPPGSVVPFFQSLGMTFGRDQNAFTNFEQTTYQLSLPDTKRETLVKGFTFFADVVGRLLLTPKEIDAERQIIQEERRRGLSGRQRTMYHVLERIAPGSRYGQRMTIGTEETINSVQQADFRDYYGKWYAASNATLMVVADAEPAEIIKLIEEQFGSLPKKPRPTPEPAGVSAYTSSFAIVASDPDIRTEDLRIVRIEPGRPPTLTVAQYRADLVARIGESAMNRRLSEKVARGGTSYLNARVSQGNSSNALYTAELSAQASPGKWKEALAEVALELQRARQFGFTSREIDDVRKQMISNAERALETEPTAPAAVLMQRMNGAATSGEPVIGPKQRMTLVSELLPTITPEEVAKRFATEHDTSAVAFIAVLPAGENVPTEAELLDIGTKALTVKPTKEEEVARASSLMDTLPTAGKVVESTEHEATKISSAWLSNNVRVHYRFMDERKNDVSVSIALVGGELLETAENRGITQAAQLAFGRPATTKLSSTDIRDIMTGKKISVGGAGGGGGRGGGRRGGGGGTSDAVTLSISGSPDELETGFQLAHLLLTQPKIEAPSFNQMQTFAKRMLQESLKNPAQLGARLATGAAYPADVARVQPITEEQVDRLTLDAAQAWLDKLIVESPIEVTIVGDVPKERAMDLAARYLGSLPTRDRVGPDTYANLRKLTRPDGPRRVEQTADSPTPQAFVFSGFYGTDEKNTADAIALSMASRILSTRMVKEVREDAQLVYSIGASSRAASTYPGFGLFSAAAPTDPTKTAALVEKLAQMYAAFAKDGPTADELEVAKKQFANTYEEQVREPGYWARKMDQITFRGASLDDVVKEEAAYQALTTAGVRETFAKYYAPQRSIVVVVTPKSEGGNTP